MGWLDELTAFEEPPATPPVPARQAVTFRTIQKALVRASVALGGDASVVSGATDGEVALEARGHRVAVRLRDDDVVLLVDGAAAADNDGSLPRDPDAFVGALVLAVLRGT